MANALTLYFLWPLAAIGPLAAALLYHRTLAALAGMALVLVVYIAIYRVVSLQHIHKRIKSGRAKPAARTDASMEPNTPTSPDARPL
jgi:hypothetical protein